MESGHPDLLAVSSASDCRFWLEISNEFLYWVGVGEQRDVLRTVVADRRQKIQGDDKRTRVVLNAALEELRPRETDLQSISWFGRRWAANPAWCSRTADRLRELADKVDRSGMGDELTIRRCDVFDCREDPVDLFLAAMAWGFGTTGYGWSRTAKMINPGLRNEEEAVAAAVGAYRSAWAEGGAEAVAQSWERGTGRIAGLGPAFGSKVAYFAIYDRDKQSGPLIADLNTAWSVWALSGIWDSRYNSTKYAEYVAWCVRWADELHCRSDDIERALFGIGPHVRAIYREMNQKL